MSTKIETLGDALPKEITRCEELLTEYASLGPVGAFGHAAISAAIADARKATSDGDVVGMLHAYERLKGCK